MVSEIEESKRPTTILDEADDEAERFFAQGEMGASAESLSPSTIDEDAWDDPARAPLSPELLGRRARLRMFVAVVVGTTVVFLVGAAGLAHVSKMPRILAHSSARARATSVPTAARSALVLAAPTAAPEPLVLAPSSAPVVAAQNAESSASVLTVPSADADTPNVATQSPESSATVLTGPTAAPSVSAASKASTPAHDGAASPLSDDDAHRLTREARTLLRAGRTRDGIARAREAIEANVEFAEPYVLLAAGLEDLGAWREAHATFVSCAERTHSPECSYFARGR